MLLNEIIKETKDENQQPKHFLEPGSCYLKLLEFFSEEKQIREKDNSFKKWQDFNRKYFEKNM